jgi:hypothetical protein
MPLIVPLDVPSACSEEARRNQSTSLKRNSSSYSLFKTPITICGTLTDPRLRLARA